MKKIPKTKSEVYTDLERKNLLKGLMLQYSIVVRTYRNPEGKRIAYIHLTDGFTHVAISRDQMNVMLKQAEKHDRYEIGIETYGNPTGDQKIDGFEIGELKVEGTHFHHIFIRPEHLDEVFEEFQNDRKITFLNQHTSKV